MGVWFSTSDLKDIEANFFEKIEKNKKMFSNWSARRLTLLGRIAILKSLAVSQIVYVLSSVPTPQGVIKEINSLLYDFLWDGKSDKIKRTEMINSSSKGGLKMIDIQSFNQSLKMKWVKGYLDDDNQAKWKFFVNHYLERHGGNLVFSSNLKRQDVPLLNLTDPFLAEIVEYWSTLNYRDENLDFFSTEIWHNSLIRIKNRPFFYKSWFNTGVKEIRDLLDAEQNVISYNTFTAQYNSKTNYLEYYKAVSALKHFRKKCSSNLNNPTRKYVSLLSSSNVCKTFYECIIEKKTIKPYKKPGKMAF